MIQRQVRREFRNNGELINGAASAKKNYMSEEEMKEQPKKHPDVNPLV